MRGTFVITLSGEIVLHDAEPQSRQAPPARSAAKPFASPFAEGVVLGALEAAPKLSASACARSRLARIEARCHASGYATNIGGVSVLHHADRIVCVALRDATPCTTTRVHLDYAQWLEDAWLSTTYATAALRRRSP